MKDSLKLAETAFAKGEVPVGCVIALGNKVISTSHNKMRALKNQTAHAEMLAIAEACEKLDSGYLEQCDMYVTLEPCNMCAAAISFVRIKRVYFAAEDEKFGAIHHNCRIFHSNNKNGVFHKPEVYDGFMSTESELLLKSFFRNLRNGA